MKKVALSLLALAVVAAGAFADAPKWDPKVSTEFKGEATVTLGYDLDTGIAALKNGTSVSLIVDLVSGGDKSTASDADVWGEIKIKTDGDPYRIKADGVASEKQATFEQGFKLQVDFATIHFGKSAYLKITSKDTKIGYANSPDLAFLGHVLAAYKYVDAVAAVAGTAVTLNADGTGGTVGYTGSKAAVAGHYDGTRYGYDKGASFSAYSSEGAVAAGGAELGFSLEKVASLSVIVGSTDAWSTDLVNTRVYSQIAYKATVGLLAVENLTLEAGYSASTIKDGAKALGAKAGYKYAIDGDKLYVKPSAGLTQTTPAGVDAKAYNLVSAGVLLGTGAKADAFDNYGFKQTGDYASYPGFSAGVFYSDKDVVNETNNEKADLGLNLSFNSGALIDSWTVLGAYEIGDLNATDLASLITVGFTGSLKSGDITFAPKGVINYLSVKEGVVYSKNGLSALADSSAYVKATVDITGVIPFVTFTVNYESNDLVNGYGDKADKNGKVELTTKVSF